MTGNDTFCGQLEHGWFVQLNRLVMSLGGTPEDTRRAFQDPQRLLSLARCIMASRDGEAELRPHALSDTPVDPGTSGPSGTDVPGSP